MALLVQLEVVLTLILNFKLGLILALFIKLDATLTLVLNIKLSVVLVMEVEFKVALALDIELKFILILYLSLIQRLIFDFNKVLILDSIIRVGVVKIKVFIRVKFQVILGVKFEFTEILILPCSCHYILNFVRHLSFLLIGDTVLKVIGVFIYISEDII